MNMKTQWETKRIQIGWFLNLCLPIVGDTHGFILSLLLFTISLGVDIFCGSILYAPKSNINWGASFTLYIKIKLDALAVFEETQVSWLKPIGS